MLSYDDMNVNSQHTLTFFNQIVTNPASRMVLYSNDEDLLKNTDQRYSVTRSAIPDKNILDLAHTSATMPCDDPHYGLKGDYRNCLAYWNDRKKQELCRQGDDNLLGEINRTNRRKGTVQRLTCNPFYKEMITELDRFLEKVSSTSALSAGKAVTSNE